MVTDQIDQFISNINQLSGKKELNHPVLFIITFITIIVFSIFGTYLTISSIVVPAGQSMGFWYVLSSVLGGIIVSVPAIIIYTLIE